jgi:glycosyltransferase involved in cell wall biosynthesis
MNGNSRSLSMLGWALNEEESIGGYIERAGEFLRRVTDDYELIILDDSSTDRPWDIAFEYQNIKRVQPRFTAGVS